MGTISEKLTYLNRTKQLLKDKINNLGGSIDDNTTFRQYANQLQNVYDNLPKTEYQEGTEVNLGVTSKGKLDFDNGVVGYGDTEQAILPSEYQQVEYIESSGSQYINTQYYANQKTKIIADYYIQPNAEGFIFGARVDGSDTNQFGIYFKENENRYAYRFDNLSVINIYGTVGVKTHAELSTNKYLINNGTIIQDDIQYTGTFLGTLPLYVLAQNQGGTATMVSNIKLYSFKILEDNKLIRNMIPCYRISDNVIGMYDTVNNVFYTNAGTGTFGKGANAPTPNAEIPIKCVTGNQDVVVSGKNEFDKDNLTIEMGTIDSSGNFDNSTIRARAYTLDLESNETYTISSSNSNLNVVPYYYNSSDTFISFDNGWKTMPYTFTMPNNATKLKLLFKNGSTDTITLSELTEMQLEQGSTATPYEPYITPTSYQLSIGDIELFEIVRNSSSILRDKIIKMNGKFYKEKNVGKVEVDSTLNPSISLASTNTARVVFSNLLANNPPMTISGVIGYSNYFKQNANWGTDAEGFFYDAGNYALWFRGNKSTIGATEEAILSWIHANKPYFIYPLATSVLEEITDTNLINQLEAWYNAHSLNGTTIITSNGNLPMIIKVRGLKGE